MSALLPFVPHETMLALIDLHTSFTQALRPARGKSLMNRASAFLGFAEALGICPLIVGSKTTGCTWLFLPEAQEKDPSAKAARQEMIQTLWPQAPLAQARHFFLHKGTDGLFETAWVNKWMKKAGIRTIFFGGIHSNLCLGLAAKGAVDNDYRCGVLTDLTANSHMTFHEGGHGGDPRFHQRQIEAAFPLSARKMVFTSTLELAAHLRRGRIPFPSQERAP